jgi:[acyl-carrier-protein] S-malonyltransferase
MAKLAVLFAGQGAQYPGMGSAWNTDPAAAKRIAEASRILGYELLPVFAGEDGKLDDTLYAQPASPISSKSGRVGLRPASSVKSVLNIRS